MGKPKKGRKNRQDDEFDDDSDVDILKAENTATEAPEPAAKPANKKAKKSKKKKEEDWDDDDVADEIAKLSLQNNEEDSDELNVVLPSKNKKKDKKKNKKAEVSDEEEEDMVSGGNKKGQKIGGGSAFAMFAGMSDSEEEQKSSEEEEEEVKPVQKNKKDKPKKQASIEEQDEEMAEDKPQESKQKGKKQKGKKGKKNKEEEEDIDALLAEIEGGGKTEGEGKKKGKKKEKMERPPTPEITEESKGIDMNKDMADMTEEELARAMGLDFDDDVDDKKKKKKGKKGKEKEATPEEGEKEDQEGEGEDEEEEGTSVKTAAQKKKEKKEKQRLKKLEEKKKQKGQGTTEEAPKDEAKDESKDTTPEPASEAPVGDTGEAPGAEGEKEEGAEETSKKKKKKDKKKKAKDAEEKPAEEPKKKKISKMALAIQEQQRKIREEEERLRKEEDERERILEEARQAKIEQERLKEEAREKKKQEKKERIDKLKAEGKYLTPKQREAQRRAQQMLAAIKAQGGEVPSAGAEADKPKKRVVYTTKKKKPQKQTSVEEKEEAKPEEPSPKAEETAEKAAPAAEKVPEKAAVVDTWEDEVKDDWAMSSEDEADTKEEETKAEPTKKEIEVKDKAPPKTEKQISQTSKTSNEEEEEESEEESSDEEESSSEEESSEEESSSDDDLSPQEKARAKAEDRIAKRKEAAMKNQSVDKLRAAVVCVLGHVDTGKTKILDKLRKTNVQDGEAGGITQQIGATNVPQSAIKDQTKMVKEFAKKELKLPGLLIIDTPGHESFSNLRNRGSSLCDIAVLVVDIMHGLEPQTIESIQLLRSKRCPFVVALNKVDRLYQWQSNPHGDVVNTLKKQKQNTTIEFEERTQKVIVEFAEQGLNACLFYNNKNPKEYISLVPTSAHSGDGVGNLMALLCELAQTHLAKNLMYSTDFQATVMEVKALPGLGTTVDVILVNGKIKEGDTVCLPGTEGPIVTQIRGLLMPQPMRELRVKSAYVHHKEVEAAQGVKIIAKDLEKTLAGLPCYLAEHPDEVEIYKEDLEEALEEVLSSIKLSEKGVFVQASTLGSLEALLEFLRTSKIPYAGINIGPVHKRDITKVSVMLERDVQYAVILAFDVKVERDAQEMADSLGIQVFTADIIYHLFDRFMDYREKYKQKKQDEFKHVAVFPCKLRVLPQYIFNSRDPIVCGVIVEAGFIKLGTPICVPSKEFVNLGIITSLEVNHKQVEKATKGQEVCIKIESTPGEAPKLYGRHFDHTDLLISKISRASIDAVKNYFREEMGKTDWQLILELKKLFEIL